MTTSRVQVRMARPFSRSARGLVIAAAFAFALPAAAQTPAGDDADDGGSRVLIDRIAAVVNDDVVLYSDVMLRAAPMIADLQGIADPSERQRRLDDLESRVIDEIVAEELVIQAGASAGVEIEDKEITAALDEIRSQNNLSDADFEQALRAQGYTMSGYRDDLERQMLRMRTAKMLVGPRVKITEEMVRTRYEQMARESKAVSRVKLRHILVEVETDGDDDARRVARDRAAELAQQARAGAAFDELAREHSDDVATSGDGGDLGWIERGSLATEWEDVVFAMEKGEIRGPITGPRGFHIFHVDERERDELPPFAEAKESIRRELFQKEMARETDKWLEELRRGAHIDIKLDS